MPREPREPMRRMVSSVSAATMPSPPAKRLPCMARRWARKAESSAAAIFAAQEAFAPSQIMPETTARVLTTEEAISSRLPPRSQVAAAATPLEALVAPQ